MGLSAEVIVGWLRGCTSTRDLEQVSAAVQQQRDVIAQREAAKAAKQQAKASG